MPKATRPNGAGAGIPSHKHQNPLADDLVAAGPLRTKSKKRKARKDDVGDGYIDSKSSRKILKIGQELADEDHEATKSTVPSTAFTFESRFESASEEEDDSRYDDEAAWGDEEEEMGEDSVCASPAPSKNQPNLIC